MKKQTFITILLSVLMSMVGAKVMAYDITAKNADGVTIYYNYINEGAELSVTNSDNGYSGVVKIPEEVTYNDKTYKVTEIGKWAFSDCSDLTSVTIPNTVTTIRHAAFFDCSGLSTITIPQSVTSIDNYSFNFCTGLTSVTVLCSPTFLGDSGPDAEPPFSCCENIKEVTFDCETVTPIFDGVSSIDKVNLYNTKVIGSRAFYSFNLASIDIPNSVTTIGDNAFKYCSSLTSITIPDNVTTIGDNAFQYCSSLTSITIPDNVTSIGDYAFSGCSSLTSVILGYYLNSLGSQAFYSCDKLSNVYCYAPVPPNNLSCFSGGNRVLYVPSACLNDYLQYKGPVFQSVLPIPDSGAGKLATPSITIDNGVLKFDCGTDGAEYNYSITYPKSKSNTVGNNVQLPQSFTVSVCAIKAGYEKSDTATKQFTIASGLRGDLNGDGDVNVADHVELSDIILGK